MDYRNFVHSTRNTRAQSLDRLNWEATPRWLKIRGKKATRKPKRAISPSFHGVNFRLYILSNIEVINTCVSSKYINQPSASHPCYCATKSSRKNDSCRNFYEILRLFGRASSFIDTYIWRGFGDKILVERLYSQGGIKLSQIPFFELLQCSVKGEYFFV